MLVVDDEHETRELIRLALERESCEVAEASDGAAARRSIQRRTPDLVVLDLGLPDTPGIDVLREIREAGTLPVIILSGRSDETDRVVGLELGADDYVTKPFSLRELAARVKTILRRSSSTAQDDRTRFGELTIDFAAHEVEVRGVTVGLTNREFDLLAFLARSPRHVFTAEQLLDQVWNTRAEWQSRNTISEHVYRLRRKLERDPHRPRWLVTVRGAGYRFEP